MSTSITSARASESNTEWIIAVSSLSLALAILFVLLRIYTRIFILKMPSHDDVAMSLSLLASCGYMASLGVQAANGVGKHFEMINQDEGVRNIKHATFVQGPLGTAGLFFLKISVALALLRLSRSKWYSWTLRSLIVFCIAYTLFAWGTLIFHCTPIAGDWDERLPSTCYPISLFVIFAFMNTAFNIITDIAFATLPIPVIWSLHTKLRTRLYLIGVLSLGYFAVIMGAISSTFQFTFATDKDIYFLHGIQFWRYIQLNTGIIAACAPTLKPLVGSALKLTTPKHGYYEDGGAVSGNLTRRTNMTGYIVQTTPAGDFELGGRAFCGQAQDFYSARVSGGVKTPSNTVYEKDDGAGDRSGSEEMILHNLDGKGIVMTTEITVQH